MKTSHLRSATPWLPAAVVCCCCWAAAGSQAGEPSLDEARALWQAGRYETAQDAYTKLRDREPAAAAIGLSRCLESQGEWKHATETLEKALAAAPNDLELQARLAEMLYAQGRIERARELADRVVAQKEGHLLARWVLAQIARDTGKITDANRLFEWFIHYYNAHDVQRPEDLVLVGLGASQYICWNARGQEQRDQFNFVLNDLYYEALKRDERFWQAAYQAAQLWLEKYDKQHALPDLQKALTLNSSAAEAYVALGTAAFQDYKLDEAQKHCARALEINPHLPAALRLKADLALADDDPAAAIKPLEEARAINPADEETLGRLAAAYRLAAPPAPGRNRGGLVAPPDLGSWTGQLMSGLELLVGVELVHREPADQLVAEVTRRNPKPAVFYYTLAEALDGRKKYDDAERNYLHAARLWPQWAAPKTAVGLVYMRTGREAEARTILEEAFEADPFHVRAYNSLLVLDHLAKYQTIETPHFVVRFDPKMDEVLGAYMGRYLEEIYQELCGKFGYEPPQRTLIESFNRHEMFSGRVIGLPELHTVGASTGKLVAITSPRAMKKPFNWARVLKHELVHVITLQQTNFNIPHWYTEALAVMSEGYPRPQTWNELLVKRVPAGETFNLDTINLAFIRPKGPLDWQMAYCQALLYAEYMVERFGKESLSKMLDAYRDGLSTEEALQRHFGVTKDKFEVGYGDYLKKIVSELKARLDEKPQTFAEVERSYLEKPDDPVRAAKLALEHLRREDYRKARELAAKSLEQQPHQPLAAYVMARLAMVTDDTERALAHLEPALDKHDPDLRVLELLAQVQMRLKHYDKAAELYELGRKADPYASQWPAGLAKVYLLQNNREKLVPVLENLAKMDADDAAVRKKLANLAADAEDSPRSEHWAKMALEIDVQDADLHRLLADACFAQKKYAPASEEYAIAVRLKPKDTDLRLKLARAYKESGHPAKAREELKAILDAQPDLTEAKELLKSL